MRFKLFDQVDEGTIAPLPSKFWSPTPVGNAGGRDGVRVVKENGNDALAAGAAEPLREAAGRLAVAPVVDCGAARSMEMIG